MANAQIIKKFLLIKLNDTSFTTTANFKNKFRKSQIQQIHVD